MPETFLDRWRLAIARAGAPLCVGLDPDPEMFPSHLERNARGCREFLAAVIETTRDLVAAYKPNLAFFEAYGPEGIEILESLRSWAGPGVLLIADGKRGDVAHTNEAYARFLFGRVKADAVTVQPYLGGEPLAAFCREPDKGMFVLCATSNPGAGEVQELEVNGEPLYVRIARQARTWSAHPNVGLVLGTTKLAAIERVLNVAADLPLLLPGSGAQGGDTRNVLAALRRAGASGLFNFSRSVLYASRGKDFAEAARAQVVKLKTELLAAARS
jgi:orotidine-5'-phosphate decarboxylase